MTLLTSYFKGEYFSLSSLSPEMEQQQQHQLVNDDNDNERIIMCPSKLREDYSSAESINHARASTMSLTISFIHCQQTNSRYLNPTIRDLQQQQQQNNHNNNNLLVEVEYLVTSISNAIQTQLVDEDDDDDDDYEENKKLLLLQDCEFETKGCIWTMNLNPNRFSSTVCQEYQLQAVCSARKDQTKDNNADNNDNADNEDQPQTPTTFCYVVETNVIEKNNPLHPVVEFPAKASTSAKSDNNDNDEENAIIKQLQIAFDTMAHSIGKAVVKCEFPNFPEGFNSNGNGDGTAKKRFKETYKLTAKLKTGTYSTICRGIHRETGVVVCIKCVRRGTGIGVGTAKGGGGLEDGSVVLPMSADAAIYDEVALLSSIGSHNHQQHNNNHHQQYNPLDHIVPLIDFFEEDDCYYLVKELQTGGEILHRIGSVMGASYGEGDARDIMRNILHAMVACHEHDITHRDINPKNILLVNEESHTNIKLTGFSFAARCHGPQSLKKQLGTPVFVAPEVLRNQPYDERSDMWSVGVLAFLLVTGRLPFVGLNQRELFRNIVSGKFEFDDYYDAGISPDAKTFISRLLIVDPSKRMTAVSASKHLWMQLNYAFLQKRNLKETAERIKVFYEKQQIHKQQSERHLKT